MGRRITNEVCSATGITPDVTEIEPVTHFVCGGTSQVELAVHGIGSRCSECLVVDYHTVGLYIATGELRISEEA